MTNSVTNLANGGGVSGGGGGGGGLFPSPGAVSADTAAATRRSKSLRRGEMAPPLTFREEHSIRFTKSSSNFRRSGKELGKLTVFDSVSSPRSATRSKSCLEKNGLGLRL